MTSANISQKRPAVDGPVYSTFRDEELAGPQHLRDERQLEAEGVRDELARLRARKPIPFLRSPQRIARKCEVLERRLRELQGDEELVEAGTVRPPLWER